MAPGLFTALLRRDPEARSRSPWTSTSTDAHSPRDCCIASSKQSSSGPQRRRSEIVLSSDAISADAGYHSSRESNRHSPGTAVRQPLGNVSAMSAGQSAALVVPTEIACGVAAGPLFVSSFMVIGARRAGYDWRRHAVSSLARGRGGWLQRANFVLTGTLYCIAANGVARSPKQTAGPRVVSALIFGVGGGLIGSGLFVTDPVAGFRPASRDHDDPDRTPSIARTRRGRLHNLCAIPIFAGIPVAALICATSAARRGSIAGLRIRLAQLLR